MTLWRYTNMFIIIIIILNVRKEAYINKAIINGVNSACGNTQVRGSWQNLVF